MLSHALRFSANSLQRVATLSILSIAVVAAAGAAQIQPIDESGTKSIPADSKWGKPVRGVEVRALVGKEVVVGPGDPIVVWIEVRRLDKSAVLPETPQFGLSWIRPGEKGRSGTMLRLKEVEVHPHARVGELTAKARMRLDQYWRPPINTPFDVTVEYHRGYDGGRAVRAKSAPIRLEVRVPPDEVLDYYVGELVAKKARESGRQRCCSTYPVDELLKLGESAARRLLELVGTDDDPRVRATAAFALLSFRDHGKILAPGLADALSDENKLVRIEAMRALVRFGETAAAAGPKLLEAIANGMTSCTASYRIGRLGPTMAPRLVDLLSNPKLRKHALAGLKEIGEAARPAVSPSVDELRKYLGDEDEGTRMLTAQALWSVMQDTSGARVLADALTSNTDSIRAEAAITLISMGEKAAEWLPRLQEAIDRERVKYVVNMMRKALDQAKSVDSESEDLLE